MPWNKDGSRKTSALYKKSGFKMKGWSAFTAAPTRDKLTGLHERPDTEDKYNPEAIAARKAEKETNKARRQAERKIKRAKRKVRKSVGDITVDSPTYDPNLSDRKFKKAERKQIEAVKLLEEAGYDMGQIEEATGAGGYDTAMDWATEPMVTKKDKKLSKSK